MGACPPGCSPHAAASRSQSAMPAPYSGIFSHSQVPGLNKRFTLSHPLLTRSWAEVAISMREKLKLRATVGFVYGIELRLNIPE